MKIDFLLEFIKQYKEDRISRGTIIDFIADHNDRWILVLKALLIKNTNQYISKHYLLEKLRFMQNNPLYPENFLDLDGIIIFDVLIGE